MATEIKFCKNCADNKITHEFQDEKYGKFIRVFNKFYMLIAKEIHLQFEL